MRGRSKSESADEAGAALRASAGVTLRDARLATGQTLGDVAAALRIRLVYLQAIEDGRYEELPGAAYATGFLRSLSEHLALDPDTIVRLYKDEMSGRESKQELYFPTPAAEGRVPGGTLLFATLLLAGAVYGGWYYLSATDRSIVDVVPALPERLVALVEGLPWRSGGEAGRTSPGDPLGSSSPTGAIPLEGAPPTATTTAMSIKEVPIKEVQINEGAPKVAGAVPSVPPSTPSPVTSFPVAVAPVAVAPVTVPSKAGAIQGQAAGTVTSLAPPPVLPLATTTVARQEPEEESEGNVQEPTPLGPGAGVLPSSGTQELTAPAPELPEPTRVFGVTTDTSRIQLRATQDSWVQVKDGGGDLLFTRVLKPGEVYRVPDRPGIRVRTGNAGGLIVVTDGVAGPPMGAVGQVLRDVPLDAPSLRPTNG